MREEIEEHLGVIAGVNEAQILLEKFFLEFPRIIQVAVVHHRDAVRRIHDEGLDFFQDA